MPKSTHTEQLLPTEADRSWQLNSSFPGLNTSLDQIPEVRNANRLSKDTQAVLWMLLGSVSMALMNTSCNLLKLHARVSPLTVAVFRGVGMQFLSYLYCKQTKVDVLQVSKKKWFDCFMRCVLGWVATIAMFAAVYCLPFSIAMVLNFTQPVWCAIIAAVFNGEKMTRIQWLAVIFGLVGVVILMKPDWVFIWLDGTRGFDVADYPYFYLGCVFGLSSGISSGFAYLYMRRMGQDVDPSTSLFYFALTCTIGSYLVMVVMGDIHVEPYDLITIAYLALAGFLGFTAQLGVNTAISMSKAGPLAALNYLQVVIAFLFDITLFGATMQWTDIVGTLCIIGWTLFGSLQGLCQPKK